MNIKEEEISKLKAMLDGYKAQHGTVSEEMVQTANCSGCSNFCTYSCNTYCDGSSGMCWKLRYR